MLDSLFQRCNELRYRMIEFLGRFVPLHFNVDWQQFLSQLRSLSLEKLMGW
jgi:hypothetical protein